MTSGAMMRLLFDVCGHPGEEVAARRREYLGRAAEALERRLDDGAEASRRLLTPLNVSNDP